MYDVSNTKRSKKQQKPVRESKNHLQNELKSFAV